jgi:MFS family permease
MSNPSNSAPLTAFKHRDFRYYEVARLAGTLGIQMQSVAVGWQVYDISKSAFDLGMVGLLQFAPALLLALLTGHVADRFDRRQILIVYYIMMMLCAAALYWTATSGMDLSHGLTPIYAILVLFGTARAFGGPAASALLPSLVPTSDFANALAWNSSVWQIATVLGPALGGVLYGLHQGPADVYLACGILSTVALLAIIGLHIRTGRMEPGDANWSRLLAGIHYVRTHQVLLGAISLDLFAVLLGGAVALLPIYARDILHIGPMGLGVLRSAPALGAALMAVYLAYRPLRHNAGKVMLGCVALFGAGTCVFALSTSFTLSLLCLVTIGAADLVSVFVRTTLVQLRTPPAMRGRVGAVNQVFIGASNELGEFESGLTAAWFGTVPATLIGGVGTIAVVALWAWLFPKLRDTDELH